MLQGAQPALERVDSSSDEHPAALDSAGESDAAPQQQTAHAVVQALVGNGEAQHLGGRHVDGGAGDGDMGGDGEIVRGAGGF